MTVLKFGRKTFEEAIISKIPEPWKRDSERAKNMQCDIHKYVLGCLANSEYSQDVLDSLVVALCLEIKSIRESAKQQGKEPTPDWLIQIHTKLDEPSVGEP